jgi:pilus assembly protein CpaE
VFAVARRLYEFIVVDSAPAFSPVVIATVDGADEVVLLASMDVPSLKDARLGLDTLELMGRGRDDVRVVVNRASSKGGLAVARASEALGRKVDVVIPYDAAVPRSYNEGTPLVVKNRRNGVSKAIHELRKAVAAAHATPSSHHNLARLMGRS